MTERQIRAILDSVAEGKTTATAAMRALRELPFQDLGFAKLDHHRTLRRGFPEVILGQTKTVEQLVAIGRGMIKSRANFIVSRLAQGKAQGVRSEIRELSYDAEAQSGACVVEALRIRGRGELMVISAGTSDIPVAEEAGVCAELFGNRVPRLYDVGVAGLQRLTANL